MSVSVSVAHQTNWIDVAQERKRGFLRCLGKNMGARPNGQVTVSVRAKSCAGAGEIGCGPVDRCDRERYRNDPRPRGCQAGVRPATSDGSAHRSLGMPARQAERGNGPFAGLPKRTARAWGKGRKSTPLPHRFGARTGNDRTSGSLMAVRGPDCGGDRSQGCPVRLGRTRSRVGGWRAFSFAAACSADLCARLP
jgi:hypothetical protein